MKILGALFVILLLLILCIIAVMAFMTAYRHRNDSYDYDRKRYGGYDEKRDRDREMEAYRRGMEDAYSGKTGGSGSPQSGPGVRADGRPRRPIH